MIKISKNNKVIKIPTSAYKEYYKSAGWKIVEDDSNNSFKDDNIFNDVKDVESDSDEDWDNLNEDGEYEKSLSEMNKEELTTKAMLLGIDISDCTSNKQIRDRIRKNS